MFRVLHLENSLLVQKQIMQTCQQIGIEYIPSKCNSEAAFGLLKWNRFDLIITGMVYDDLENGQQFIDRIHASEFRTIPLIVVSADDELKTREVLLSQGVVDFIPKDVKMVERIDQYLIHLKKDDEISRYARGLSYAAVDDSRGQLNFLKSVFDLNSIKDLDGYLDPVDLLKGDKSYDVVFLDMITPSLSEEALIFAMREKFPDSLLIAVSAIDNYRTISRILTAGADDYIMKPYDATILIARLKANVRTFMALQQLRELNEKLKIMALTDGLTNLFNHEHIFQRTEEEVEKARRHRRKLSVMMIDIDHFKKVNDTWGHQVGDEVIRGVSACLKKSVRKIDVIGRYGGEEFLVILPETAPDETDSLIGRLQENIASMEFDISELKVTVSGGIAKWADGMDALNLIKRADELLYRAKESGRDQILV